MEIEHEFTRDDVQEVAVSRGLYSTPSLNSVLLLNHCGIRKIPDLSDYRALKCLYLNDNCLKEIPTLSDLKSLKSLFISVCHILPPDSIRLE